MGDIEQGDRILIVDDEPVNLKLLKAHLLKRGHQVLEADSGARALALAQEKPDLVLLDIMMPGMDGFETCKRLKADEATKDIPVIFLSALTDSEIKTRGLEVGGVDYVSKPFDSRELLARVKTHLTLRRQEIQIRSYAGKLEDMVAERTKKLIAAEAEIKRDFDVQTVVGGLLRRSLENQPLDEFLTEALNHIFSLAWLSFEGQGCIFLTDDGGDTLKSVGHFKLCEVAPEDCQLSGRGRCACENLADKTTIQIVDDAADSEYAHWCVPILNAGTLLGVVNIRFKKHRRPEKKEMEYLQTTANTLAAVILYKRAEEKLLHHAFHDELTGLPNRAKLLDRLDEEAARVQEDDARTFAVLVMDLDRFTIINESLGHALGDKILCQTAERLKTILGPNDLLFRLGGDEFAVLCRDMDVPAYAEELAVKALSAVSEPIFVETHELDVTSSIGIAFSNLGFSKPEDLLRDADAALHRAKTQGKARYAVFDREMYYKARNFLELVTDLRRGLERDEFSLHYQPIIRLADESLTGFEALIRWTNPKRGFVFPGDFIPVAEESGLIVPMGDWVLREAMTKIERMKREAGFAGPIMMSVNLSGRQFSRPDLFESIQDAIEQAKFDPRMLKLEITESVVMENAKIAEELLNRLKSLSVQLSIDDFGTGYSSLSYLHRFPVDMLKIDRSFIGRMNGTGENVEIVRTIVALAHNLGLKVIAEGVETAGQLAILKDIGCEYCQGYFYSKPQPEEVLLKENYFFRDWSTQGEGAA